MEIERDCELRAYRISDPNIPVAVVNGEPVNEIAFSDKTMRVISEYLRATGGFATVWGVK